MSAPNLPRWVWDLVIDLQKQEAEHPELLYTSGAFEGTAKYDWCPCNSLAGVPQEVQDAAAVIASYRSQVGGER